MLRNKNHIRCILIGHGLSEMGNVIGLAVAEHFGFLQDGVVFIFVGANSLVDSGHHVSGHCEIVFRVQDNLSQPVFSQFLVHGRSFVEFLDIEGKTFSIEHAHVNWFLMVLNECLLCGLYNSVKCVV